MKNHVMKTNRAFKEFCVLGGLAYSVCGVAQERPNIIVFLVDDMGLMDTSVPFLADESGQPVRHPLNDWYHTPNMERLAKQGICFSTFYAQSVSSPSRASIMTGQMRPGMESLTGLTLKVITGLLSDHPNGTGKVSERICLLCPESCNKPDIRRFM